MTADFLLELLSEEIPARMQARASADLARLFEAELASAGLRAEAIETYATPRRLALIARGLPTETAVASEEIKGPRASAPPQALEGFLRKTGLNRDQLIERDGVLFASLVRAGRATASVLAEAVPAIIRDFPWPKSMRWGEASIATDSPRWVRPLQGIVALLGEEIVAFEVAGISSGAASIGHRVHHPGVITIGGANDYAEKLRACHVVLDPTERRRLILEGARQAASEAGLALVEDEGLLAENAGLTEWPVPLLGAFDPAYLDVPREVIQLTMRTNQKYFSLVDRKGTLSPNFICVANVEARDGGKAITEGNRKVLAARLADARYFWEHDLKVPLEDLLPKLEGMVFYEGMGTLREKAERIADLAAAICRDHFPERDPETARRAGLLAKADLASGMVGEFPELQGVMGGHYAEAAGEEPGIVSAIRQQYVSAAEGCIPACVALADRIDTLASFFARGIRPTGSKDPFALRRAALQTIETIILNGARIKLRPVFRLAVSAIGRPGDSGSNPADVETVLLDFVADRLKVQQREAGIRHDLIDAVFALDGEDDLLRLLARVRALQSFVETADGADLLTGYKRGANILRRESWNGRGAGRRPPSFTLEREEAALIAALDGADPKVEAAIAGEDFEAAMAALASLRGPVDSFFDTVTVNDPDSARRESRLNLLARMRDAFHRVADFSRIEG